MNALVRNWLWLRLPCLVLALLAGACGDDATPQPATEPVATVTPRSEPPPDPLKEAPLEWEGLVSWAKEELARTPDAVPLPAPPAGQEQRWSVRRLDEMLAQARIQCDWQPPPKGPDALFCAGPLRQELAADASPSKIAAQRLMVRGINLERQDVGSIVLEIKATVGEHFDLSWARAGKIRVQIPDNDSYWKLNIETDGLPEWEGPLDEIVLQPDGVGPGFIELRSIRLLGRVDAFPDPAGVRRVAIGRETRNALYVHNPAEVTFAPIKLPDAARLQVGLAKVSTSPEGTPATTTGEVLFTVWAESDGRRESVLRHHLLRDDHWEDVTVDLGPWAGRTVSLSLATEAGPGDTAPSPAVACWGNPVVYEAQPEPPCVIIYLIDALASGHINLYGYFRPTMPHLTELAGRGVWFANAYANSPRTVESVPDLMLSMPTARHGVRHPSAAAPPEFTTLAEALRATGVATASFCTNVNAGRRQAMDQGFDHFIDRIGFWWSDHLDRTVPIEEIRTWLEVHRDRPTFLYVHTAEPHAPYAPPPGFAGRFDPDYQGNIDGTHDSERGFRQCKGERDRQHVVALYDEEIVYADARLKAFLDALSSSHLSEQMTIFVTSDHGEAFGEHGTWEHSRHLHAELTRIPLVAAGPMVTARGRQDLPAQLYDLMPTVLEMFGVPPPHPPAGHSLMPLLVSGGGDTAALTRRWIFSSSHSYRRAGLTEHAVLADARWRLLYRYAGRKSRPGTPPAKFLLFDIQADPGEKQNVIDAQRDVARRLIGGLIAWHRQQAPFDLQLDQEHLTLDGRQLHELRSLGYIE